MKFISPEMDIQLLNDVDSSQPCLYFKFKGKFITQTSVSGTKAWAGFMDDQPNQPFEFVWDCTDMSGFEVDARKEWYKAMSKYKKRISTVYVISDKLMIRSAAKVMLQLFGIPSKIGKSSEILPQSMQV